MLLGLVGRIIRALVRSAAREKKVVELTDAKRNGDAKGFDYVLRNKDGSITILASCQQLPDGSVELDPDAAGGFMQMSDDWVENVLDKLDRNSAAWKTVIAAEENGTLFKAVVGVDRVSGNLSLVRLK